jgi:hypothetical protein
VEKRKILPLAATKSQHPMIIKTVRFLEFKKHYTVHIPTHFDTRLGDSRRANSLIEIIDPLFLTHILYG